MVIDPREWSNDGAALVGRDAAAAQALEARRAELRKELDGRLFERDDLAWYRGACVEAFLFMYDTSFYDRAARRYRIEEILDDGEREFGGYDFVLLWQSYPRAGHRRPQPARPVPRHAGRPAGAARPWCGAPTTAACACS